MKRIDTERRKPDPENLNRLIYDGQRTVQEVFSELRYRLESTGYLPDEYFMLDRDWDNGREWPESGDIFCTVDFGGSEGIYLDIYMKYQEGYEMKKIFSVWVVCGLALCALTYFAPAAALAAQKAQNEATQKLMASISGVTSAETVKRLILEGADVNASNEFGWTPLMYVAGGKFLFAGIQYFYGDPDPEVLLLLIENGANVSAADDNGTTPLMYAARGNSNPGVLQILIEKGANVNAANHDGSTPLMLAARFNTNPDVLRFLIENGANVNVADKNGATPLILAARYNLNHDVPRALIEGRADVAAKDGAGMTALDYAEDSELFAYYRRGSRNIGDVNLDLYHPWSDGRQARSPLNSPASFLINGDYPILDGATLAYPLYAAAADEVCEVNGKTELKQYLYCTRTEEAYNRLIRGEADIIFVLQPSDDQIKSARDAGAELHFTPIAKDAFVFFVNDSNPVPGLSVSQIRDIYLEKITNWLEVGGNDRKILPYQRNKNSGSQTAMLKEVMKGENMPQPIMEDTRKVPAMAPMVLNVAQYRDQDESIGYSFRFFTEEMMKDAFGDIKNRVDYFEMILGLIPENGPDQGKKREKYQNEIRGMMKPPKLLAVDGVAPNNENIRNGTYPFTVDLFAVTAGTANPHVQELVAWLLSPQGQELIEKTGFVGAVKQ